MEALSRGIEVLKNATYLDNTVFNECLNPIIRALGESHVRLKPLMDMRKNLKKIFDEAADCNKQIIFLQAIFNELCKMLLHHPEKPLFTPNKGNPAVVMFVGPRGSGKTTTCAKYARYHQKKGWKPALVCADTSSAAALKQNATSENIPFYVSCMESDPVKIVVEGVESIKKDENCDLIVVDTSAYLTIEYFRQVYEATKPDLVILVLDSSAANDVFAQAQAFSQSVALGGAVILTKMDCHAYGCGALNAVATLKNPVIFLGTGELMDEFELFDVRLFVSRLLGKDDLPGFMDMDPKLVCMDQPLESLKNLSEEDCTLRIMHDQFQTMEAMLAEVRPGLMPGGRKRLARIRKYLKIMNYMTDEELDSTNPQAMKESRMKKIAKASSLHKNKVVKMFEEYTIFANIWDIIKCLQFNNKEDMRLLSEIMNAHQENMVIPQLLRVSDDERPKLMKQWERSLAMLHA